jgi:hypothetical protein
MRHPLKENYFDLVNPGDTQEEEKAHQKRKDLDDKSQISNSEKRNSTVITIHDPMKRTKNQFEFKFDSIYPSNCPTSEIYVTEVQEIVHKAIMSGESAVFMGFGHKETGKSYTIQGESLMTDLNKLGTGEPDSRGFMMRTLSQIRTQAGTLPAANLTMSVCDIAMDNIRDVLKYALKLKRNSNVDLAEVLQKHTGI